MAAADASRTRACVDCGVLTYNECAEGCQAEGYVPGEGWTTNEVTPHCRVCEYELGKCHFCRGEEMPLPAPTAYRHDEYCEGMQVASDVAYNAALGEVTPLIGATESGAWSWDQGGRLDDEWSFVCEVCEASGEGTPTDSGPQQTAYQSAQTVEADVMADGYRVVDMVLTKATVPATEEQVRAAAVALSWPVRLMRAMMLGSAVKKFLLGGPKEGVLDELSSLPVVVRPDMTHRKYRWWLLATSARCTHRGIADKLGDILAHMDEKKAGLYLAFASKIEARCCWRTAFPEAGEPPIIEPVCSIPKPQKKGKIFPGSRPPLPMRIETVEGGLR